MGFLVLHSRQIMLTDYVNKLQGSLADMTREKLSLTNDITKLTSQISDISNHESPAVKKLEARLAELKQFEAKIDIEIQNKQTQIQAAQTELNSVKESLSGAIQSSFAIKYGGG